MNPFDTVLQQAPFFFLAAVRVFAMIVTTPLLSIRSVSRIAKIALAGATAYLVLPHAYTAGWDVVPFSLHFVLLVIGEGLIGIMTGFFISMLFSVFSSAGQFFSFQMGFGASSVFDALAQVENPLMGQYLNLIAMLVFLQIRGFQTLFIGGVLRSFEALNCFVLVANQDLFVSFFLKGLTALFLNAMVIAFPIFGTLILIHVSMGLLSKAAPQMNLLSEGFPITILTSFFLLVVALPFMANVFVSMMEQGFATLQQLFADASGGIP